MINIYYWNTGFSFLSYKTMGQTANFLETATSRIILWIHNFKQPLISELSIPGG